ncbi:transglutaminase-like cysteine peptidase [Ancylobacter sp. 6x-1]|uniref:Transglutaminase-like cysteine peptidase n=1 Tax=Ancylobacter crimeensis TaxID=2579147 RepID=A0ABT0D6M9_9HYPH|nr:transglutaminase-like cysteine peptidase [Ancylobacter crimeensis]MCK0195591.1 transglutaminase-like cysteine peptidase [Ancylobacter crimeensis]
MSRMMRRAAMVVVTTLATVPAARTAPIPEYDIPQMVEIGSIPAPQGWVAFCRENAGDCQPRPSPPVALTQRRWDQLFRVNAAVNGSVRNVEERPGQDVWRYPADGTGDCEDYVLEKRRRLIAAGWPPGALLITTARTRAGIGHAVLIVRTDIGEFVLDNNDIGVKPWTDVPYTLLARQSAANPQIWAALQGRDRQKGQGAMQ